MEPRNQGIGPSFEHRQAPSQSAEGYQLPGVSLEQLPSQNPEIAPNQPSRPEAESAPPATLPAMPVALPQVDDQSGTGAVQQDDSWSADAADEDLIEKEWVDRAKKIIEDTKEDPYRREQEIGQLQREYIKKRYGREVGTPTD